MENQKEVLNKERQLQALKKQLKKKVAVITVNAGCYHVESF